MTKYDYDIGIIGGGAAGLTVAAGAAQIGAKTLIIEKEHALGGDCLHYGCVPSKTLIRTSHVCHMMRQTQDFGLPKISVPPVDFQAVSARIKQVIAEIQQHDSVERFCSLGAGVEFGRPEFTDEHTVDTGEKKISARRWVIATGSSPGIPSIEGLNSISFLTNKELFSIDRLPGSMLILGAGPVAIEMAQAFNRLGTKVTVVQRSDQILSREDRDMADLVMAVLAREGVSFHLASTVVSIKGTGSRNTVRIRTGAGGNISDLEADAILVATGRTANTGSLGLEKIGVAVDRRGIKVDRRLRTTHRHIFAAGDVIGRYQFTHAAGYEGSIVVSNAVFRFPRKTNYSFMPWCTYTHPELACMGMNEKAAMEAGLDYSVWTEKFSNNDRSLTDGNHTGRIKLILNKNEKPVGVQIFGPRAGDLLCEWVAALNGGVKLLSLASAVYPYPTLGEINKMVVGNLMSKKIFSERMKKGLKFFFGFKGRACFPDPEI